MSRAIAYVDGQNLYHGIKGTENTWIDVHLLAQAVAPWASVEMTRYYTAMILPTAMSPNSPQGQQKYLDALRIASPKTVVELGRTAQHVVNAELADERGKTVRVISRVEKSSDVNLAVAMVDDAHNKRMDWAILFSNDSDLAGAARLVRQAGVRVLLVPPIIALNGQPPNRPVSMQLREQANEVRSLRLAHLDRCLLPETVQTPQGKTIYRPDVFRRVRAQAQQAEATQAEEEAGPAMG